MLRALLIAAALLLVVVGFAAGGVVWTVSAAGPARGEVMHSKDPTSPACSPPGPASS